MIEAGNEAFVAGDDDLAMQSYNRVRHKIRRKKKNKLFLTFQAFLAAPGDSWHGDCDDLALVFGNMSVLCMRQGRLRECMRDSTIALLLLDS